MTIHEEYMKRALSLAVKAVGHTSPNPMVGCVIVKDGRIIGEGYHQYCGGLHAERNAFKNCTEDAEGADLYVTLEPCCHWGKTPPCTDAIIEHKIRHVYVGCTDPNPKVAGGGIKILRDHGIGVTTGILEAECYRVNEVFFHYITNKRPFVAMKYAQTLDGKIACAGGDSKWVTGEAARAEVQELRNRYSGIMVGIGTVLADDPMLNCRMEGGVDPVRIVCDSRLRIPMDSRLVKTAKDVPLIIATAPTVWDEDKTTKEEALAAAGAKVLHLPENDGIDLTELMRVLGEEEGIDGILLEGGGMLNGSALKAGIVNKIYAFIAPKVVGGKEAPGPIGGEGIRIMNEALKLKETEVRMVGEDICISGILK